MYVIYPPPPDTPRIQFLTRISSSTDIEGKQSGFNRFLFGESVPETVIKPYGITTHGSKVYICDNGIKGIVIIDLLKKTFDNFIPSGKGQLQLPLTCSLGDNDYLYIADGNRRQVVVFDNNEKYVDAFESGKSFKPTGIKAFGNRLFVSCLESHNILVFDRDSLKLVNSFPGTEPGDPAYLYQPTNIYVTPKEVYVSDMGDNKVKIFSHSGEFLRSVGEHGINYGQLTRPKGVSVDRNSNLYVVDAAFENVQIFDSSGKLLTFFGGPYKKPGDMWLPAGIAIDYDNISYFEKFVDGNFILQYLIFVANQYGPDKISVYGFIKKR
jgi:DNA-binding beta-propeller fold protein YncE